MLTTDEKRQTIAILKYYVAKVVESRSKELRRRIHALWFKMGFSKEELRDYMRAWGYAESTRACELKQLVEIFKQILKMRKKTTKGEKKC